jgi:predicted dehydrogenase
MLDKEKVIDAVVVGTPDHTRAIVSMAAIQRGKHVYCEKPLTRTVYEARALATAAREHKVATQMGNQGMAFEGNRLMNEWLANGAIGLVREVHVWSDRPTRSEPAAENTLRTATTVVCYLECGYSVLESTACRRVEYSPFEE